MTKQILVTMCVKCPYVRFEWSKGHLLYAKCYHPIYGKPTDYEINYIDLTEEELHSFGKSCPLDDVTSPGDLTPEDIQRINKTARKIQNAKNVKDGRYG